MSDKEAVSSALAGCATVVHTSALHAPHETSHNEEQFREVNVAGTSAVLDPGCRAVVHCSTTSLLINQRVVEAERAGRIPWLDEEDRHVVPARNKYRRSKQDAEKLCREFGQDVARLTVQ